MASTDSLKVRALNAAGAIQVSRDDTPVAIRLQYVGTGSVTSVTVTTATNIVAITSDGGTDTYTFATYTTVGALADAINSDGIFSAIVLDALRADATTGSQFVTGAITAGNDDNGVVIWDVLADTSVLKAMTATLSLRRNCNVPTTLAKMHRVHLQEIVYYTDVNAGSANAVRVYYRTGSVEKQVFGRLSVDATATTLSWASGQGKLTAPAGADIIVRVQDATSLTDSTSNLVQATGIYE